MFGRKSEAASGLTTTEESGKEKFVPLNERALELGYEAV